MRKLLLLIGVCFMFGMQSCVQCESCEIIDSDNILDGYESSCDPDDIFFDNFKSHCRSVASQFNDVQCICENF